MTALTSVDNSKLFSPQHMIEETSQVKSKAESVAQEVFSAASNAAIEKDPVAIHTRACLMDLPKQPDPKLLNKSGKISVTKYIQSRLEPLKQLMAAQRKENERVTMLYATTDEVEALLKQYKSKGKKEDLEQADVLMAKNESEIEKLIEGINQRDIQIKQLSAFLIKFGQTLKDQYQKELISFQSDHCVDELRALETNKPHNPEQLQKYQTLEERSEKLQELKSGFEAIDEFFR